MLVISLVLLVLFAICDVQVAVEALLQCVTVVACSVKCETELQMSAQWTPVLALGQFSVMRAPHVACHDHFTWLILPVVICLSQRLSHACLSLNYILVKLRMAHYISYNMLSCFAYMDNCGNSRANTCT